MRRKEATRPCWRAGSAPWETGKSEATGPARRARARPAGTRTASTSPSRPEAMRPASSRLPAPAAADSSGTTVAASAPPTTTSYRTLGTWLAVA